MLTHKNQGPERQLSSQEHRSQNPCGIDVHAGKASMHVKIRGQVGKPQLMSKDDRPNAPNFLVLDRGQFVEYSSTPQFRPLHNGDNGIYRVA